MKRTIFSKSLADKWYKIGYKIVALSYFDCLGKTPMAYHLIKKL